MRKKISHYSLCLLLAVGSLTAKAQDPHFSQYFHAPMLLNPAFTGKDIADWRLQAVYRSQWWGSGDPLFKTYDLSLEKKVVPGETGNSGFSVGAYLLSDVSNGGILKHNFFSLSAAYALPLNRDGSEILGVGLQGVYANRLIDRNSLTLPSQFGSMGYQRNAPSGDAVDIATSRYLDVNAGLTYSHRFSNWGYYTGASIYHAAKPRDGITSNSQYYIPSRISLQGGADFTLGESSLSFSTSLDFQGGNGIFTLGGLYRIPTNNPRLVSLNAGIWNRFGDAVIPYFGFEFTNLLLSVTYDAVTSSVTKGYNSVQSMELGVAWLFGKKNNKGGNTGKPLVY